MNVAMKPYTATFENTWGEIYKMSCDGVSDVHANARAWLKFMDTQWYRDAPLEWKLKKVMDETHLPSDFVESDF